MAAVLDHPPSTAQDRFRRLIEPVRAVLRDRTTLRRRVPTVLTGVGRFVLFLSAVSWVVGWRLGWSEFMVISAGALLAVTMSTAFTLGRSSLAVTLSIEPKRVVVGEPAVGRITVSNSAGRGILPVRLEAPVGASVARFDLPILAGRQGYEEVFVVPTTRRSIVTLGPVTAVRGDPLGLARREVELTGRHQLYVHPRTIPISSVVAGWIRDLEGRTTNDLSNSDVAFHALRDYVPGDDRRHVHWRTTARLGGRLMVRQFVDTRRCHLGLILSLNPHEYSDDNGFELAVSVVGSIGRSLLGEQQDITCVTGASVLPAPTAERFLDGLAGVELTPSAGNVLQVAQRALGAIRSASVAVVVTGDEVTLSQLSAAVARYPAHIRALAVRCDPGAEPGLNATARATVLTVGSLDDLRRVMHRVASV